MLVARNSSFKKNSKKMSVSPAPADGQSSAWFPSKVDYADEILDMRKCGMAKPDAIA